MSSGRAGFPRERRIRRSGEFRELSRRGSRRVGRAFVKVSAPAGERDEEGGRLGITVSRKVGNSVSRNLVKRRIREWYRRRGDVGGLDLLVIARPGAAQLRRGETAPMLSALLERRP